MSKMPTEYQGFLHLSRYARWRDDLGRRETWEETVERYIDFFYQKSIREDWNNEVDWQELKKAIINLEVMPSMRALMTAGKALERDHVAGYNCAYLAVDRVRAFDEILYILMCGTGVGFSVERQAINKLPEVPEELHETDSTIVVQDSKIGWAKSYRELLAYLYSGLLPKWDMSKVRPAGARLKTFGGRSSGPGPLGDLFKFTVETFKHAKGRKLNSLEVHDIVCKIADVVVVGGVRRSALISLSNLTDERMRTAKSGSWWIDSGQRALANNSVCYTEHPDTGAFLREWLALYESRAGERGIFSRHAAKKHVANLGRRDPNHDFGTNPCSEIILRDREFCNLTEVVVRPNDSLDDLKRKVRIATILGTIQSTLTDFRYLSKQWKLNCDEERLLGVSLTGIMDHPLLSGAIDMQDGTDNYHHLQIRLQELKEHSIETNKKYSKFLGISPSTSITCVKPSGTVSQLVDSASGIHPRYSEHYIRRVRADAADPIAKFMETAGFPCEPDVTKPEHVKVFSFPMEAPKGSVLRNDRSAIEQLELWKIYAKYWCEHKPSITVYVKPDEWVKVAAWVYENFDLMSGVSFLPHSEHIYQQAPYEELTKEQYDELVTKMPKGTDWTKLADLEKEDHTTASQELACTAGACEIV
jgi:ribonucleoside-triphosphate reductase